MAIVLVLKTLLNNYDICRQIKIYVICFLHEAESVREESGR